MVTLQFGISAPYKVCMEQSRILSYVADRSLDEPPYHQPAFSVDRWPLTSLGTGEVPQERLQAVFRALDRGLPEVDPFSLSFDANGLPEPGGHGRWSLPYTMHGTIPDRLISLVDEATAPYRTSWHQPEPPSVVRVDLGLIPRDFIPEVHQLLEHHRRTPQYSHQVTRTAAYTDAGEGMELAISLPLGRSVLGKE